jgi:cell fate (sporulation/competence/biofilm development) regulator YmcA (YheA/YmcA/DUF963 family)
MKQQTVLEFAVFALLVLNILSVIYTQVKVSDITNQNNPTALAFGTTSFCINRPPSDISVGTCNFTMPWGASIQCTVNATDPENNSIYFQSYFTTPEQLFSINQYGFINVTLEKTAIGNHTLKIIAADMSGCENNLYEEDFNVEVIDINHAPYLSAVIPNRSLRWDTTYIFSLDDYFTDIDEDNLTYIVSQDDNLTVINIVEGLTTIKGADCGDSYFYFIATDPEGLTASSNIVKYTVTDCPTDSGTSTGSGGGGGGGGYYDECTPDWRCSKWSACQENGTRLLRCIDYNGCNPNNYIQFFTENCTFISPEYVCEEKWECSEWSICTDLLHTRKCLDKNSCGTTNNKPTENESCTPIPSCFNGILDGNETAVDCGGSCGACKQVEQPTTINGFDSRIIIAAAIILATLMLLGFAFRKQLKQLIDKLLAYGKKKKQPMYLTEIQKQKLLNLLFKIQDDIENEAQINIYQSINQLIQLYFMELLEIDIPSKEKIHASMHKLNNKQLEAILGEFYRKMNGLKKMSKVQMQETVDEIFNHIYLVSEFHDKDALVLPKEREMNAEAPFDKFYQRLSNLHIALEFKELIEAKNLYKELLEEYNKIDHNQKLEVYDDMMIVYNIILYLERFY